jgi:hypothetical protein
MLLPQVCRQQHPHVPAGDFRRKVAGHPFGGLAEFLDDAVLVAYDDGIHRGLEYRPISALTFLQLIFCGATPLAPAPKPCDQERGQPKTEYEAENGTS